MRTLGVAATLVAVAAAVPGAAPAWADPGEAVTAFDSVAQVETAGDLQVTETIGYRFAGTAHHGLVRELHSSQVTGVRVESPTGAPVGTSVTANGGYTTIRVGDPVRTVGGTQTYVLHYTLGRAVDADVLRWDPVGDGWQVPVQRATVRVTAPRAADTRLCAAVSCVVAVTGATAVFTAGPLAPGDGMPVTLDYPAGTLGGTSPGLAFLGWLQLAVVVAVLGGLGWFVARLLRTPRTRPEGAHRAVPGEAGSTPGGWTAPGLPQNAWTAAPRDVPAATRSEAPPAGDARRSTRAEWAAPTVPLTEAGLPAPPDIPPGLLAVLHTGGKGTDPVTATLLDLAVRGYFRVEERTGRLRGRSWSLSATAPTAPDRLLPHEGDLLHSAFDGSPSVALGTLCGGRTRALNLAHKALVDEAVARGWARKNVVVASGKAVGMGIFFLCFVAAITNFAGFPRSFPTFFLCIAAGIVGLLLTMVFSLLKPVRRTEEGDAVVAALAPYRAELAGAGLERVPPHRAAEVFTRSLPYAVAFGLARPWTQRFADLFALAPRGGASWYRPADPMAPGLGVVTATVLAFVTAAGARPSASTSSGGFASSGGSGFSSYSGGDGGGGSSSSGGGGSW
jgi:uncharacterized membrane protein YgcG